MEEIQQLHTENVMIDYIEFHLSRVRVAAMGIFYLPKDVIPRLKILFTRRAS